MSETIYGGRRESAFSAFAAPAFTAAIFASAWLLFGVQPLFTKMALPVLGGAPNVWNTAMVFFQAVLLLGYVYAHLLSSRFAFRTQVYIHLCVMAVGMLFLPIALGADIEPPKEGAQAFWLIGLMAMTIGAPFFALSANAPLLQRWFSLSGHRQAHDPYFLYAASNIGSLASLLLYPILLEPLIGVADQSRLWTIGFVLMAGLIAISSSCIREPIAAGSVSPQAGKTEEREATNPIWWIVTAIAPSGLMLSVTAHLTTNVAPTPMLWIAPLALYLLSFVLVFGARGESWRRRAVSALPFAIIVSAIADALIVNDPLMASLPPLGLYFIAAIACHGELARRRPGPALLTKFYLFMSLGGVIGGAFVALAAPMIFPDLYEYPLLVVLSALVVTGSAHGLRSANWKSVSILLCAAVFGLGSGAAPDGSANIFLALNVLFVFGAAYLVWRFRTYPVLGALAVFILLANSMAVRDEMRNGYRELIERERSFFGVTKVYRADTPNGPVHMLMHGAIIHNLQLQDEAFEKTPLAYFSDEGPFGQVIDALRTRKTRLDIAVVGLGAGALACFAAPGDSWVFYELDPRVAKIAQSPDKFSYLERCAPNASISIGDARLALDAEVKAGARKRDLIIIDAFSSDSIPAHLITREALSLYRSRLKPGGVVFFHTSNRYLDVVSVAVRLAQDAGLSYRVIRYEPDDGDPLATMKSQTLAVIVGDEASLEGLDGAGAGWTQEPPSPLVGVWTDDYSNILSALVAFIMRDTASAR